MLSDNGYIARQRSSQIPASAKSINGQVTASATVLLLCPGGLESGGGIGRQMGYFLKAQEGKEFGLDYRIIDPRGPNILTGSPFYTFLATFRFAASLLKVGWAGLSRKPCLAHINIAGRGSTVRKLLVCMAARGVGLPYVLHIHEPNYADDYRSRGRLMRFFVGRAFRGAGKILVLGSRDQRALAEVFQLPPSEITILPNAVPDPRPVRSAAPGAECRFVFLGHLSERKGVPELLRALASPALRGRSWRATLAGGGPIDDYRRLATELGIADKVEFPGWLDQAGVKAVCEAGDALVLPSHAEGLAMSVLEGLSYGLAVIATPVGAHMEVIEPGVSGLFVPPRDVDALAAALGRMIDDPALRRALGEGARRRFLEKFDVRQYAERLRSIHVSLM